MPIDLRNIEVLDEEMAAVFRAMTGAQRLKIASDMFSSARRMILSHLAAEHPDWDEQRIQQEAARRLSHGEIDPQRLAEIRQEILKRSEEP